MTLINTDWLNTKATLRLLHAFNVADTPLRFVGGCVRDALMKRDVKDIDATTPATPDHVVMILENQGIKTVPTGIRHGTITAIINSKPFEITTLRQDLSCDGRHAEVAFTDDWQEDSNRRDFTFNAIYCDANGELYDFHNGIDDAQNALVRFIGDPDARIREDGLRILRYFRFLATHSTKPAQTDALNACTAHCAMLDDLSGERIQHEMAKLLSASNPLSALEAMLPAILPCVIPGVASLESFGWLVRAESVIAIKPDSTTRLAALLRATPDPAATCDWVIERWRLSRLTAKNLQLLVSHDLIDASALESTLKSTLRTLGRDIFIRLIGLSWRPNRFDVLDVALKLAHEWTIPVFPITGDDLIKRGVKAGPQMGETLRKLEAIWEGMDYKPTSSELLELALKPQT